MEVLKERIAQAIIEIERELSHELSVNFIITLEYNIANITRLCERAISIGTSSCRDWSSHRPSI